MRGPFRCGWCLNQKFGRVPVPYAQRRSPPSPNNKTSEQLCLCLLIHTIALSLVIPVTHANVLNMALSVPSGSASISTYIHFNIVNHGAKCSNHHPIPPPYLHKHTHLISMYHKHTTRYLCPGPDPTQYPAHRVGHKDEWKRCIHADWIGAMPCSTRPGQSYTAVFVDRCKACKEARKPKLPPKPAYKAKTLAQIEAEARRRPAPKGGKKKKQVATISAPLAAGGSFHGPMNRDQRRKQKKRSGCTVM